MNKSIGKISAVMPAVMTLLSSIFVVPANAAAEDITTPEGTVRVKKDTLVATLTFPTFAFRLSDIGK